MAKKVCSKCGTERPLEEFGLNKHTKDSHEGHCKHCETVRRHLYYLEHKDKEKAIMAQWRAAHPDYSKASAAKWRATHPAESKARNARFRAAHPERVKMRKAKYRLEHRTEIRRKAAEWFTTAKGRACLAVKRFRRRVATGPKLTSKIVLDIKAEYGGICPYCNIVITKGHLDHIVPVSKGGMNTRDNLAWVCHKCNIEKGNKNLLKFMLDRCQKEEVGA